jgi:hypothetical protein
MTRQVCKQIINLSLFFAVCFLPCVPLSAQWTQLGADFDGEANSDESGRSVSLSSDGTTVAIGAPYNHGNSDYRGHVRVYKRVNGTWIQLGTNIDGEMDFESSGASVSLSSDGTIVAIGAPGNSSNGFNRGQVRVYQLVSGTWTQLGADINGNANNNQSGTSVSLSSDGMTVAIGAPGNAGGSFRGQVRVYQLMNDTWTQQGTDIYGEADYDRSGRSVSLSSDGTTVAIGAADNAGGGYKRGHVRVYQRVSGTWVQLGADIDGDVDYNEHGTSVSLSSNGTIVAIGAPFGGGGDRGQVRVYQLGSGAWTQLGADIVGKEFNDNSGASVSLSSDGTTVAIGAPNSSIDGDYKGYARVYQFGSGAWTQLGADMNGEADGDRSGTSVTLSSDGMTVAIGAPKNAGGGTRRGHVRVYNILLCTTPTAYAVTGGGSYCSGGAGVAVGLENSESGVTYQLKNGVTNVGTPVNGTGSAISFGNQTATGTYTVAATRTTDGCTATMSGSATITTNPLSTSQTLTGGGPYCAGETGVMVGLSNSESGATYQLKKDNSNDGTPVNGTGSAISFGNKTAVGTYTVVATRTNDGCTATMNSNTVISIDETLPAFVTASVPANITLNCTDIIPAAVHPTATNSCSTVSFTGETSTKGTAISQCSFYSYAITRIWTATDKRGNTATVSQVLTVQDNTAPVIAPLSNITVTEGTIPTTVASSDNCTTTPVITFTETKVNNTPPACKNYSYVLTRTWIATDVCGNSGTNTQLIKAEGIRLTCPSDKTINTNSDGVNNYNCSTLATAAMGVAPTFTDGCDAAVLRYTITGATTGTGNGSVAGIAFAKGVSTITYSLLSNVSDQCSLNITVKDNEGPKITLTPTVVLDACTMPDPIPNTYTPSVSDNCTGTNTLEVMSDVLADQTGCATKVAAQKYTKLLTRTWKATDESGNTATTVQRIYLRDMAPPITVCKNVTVGIGSANITQPVSTLNDGSNDLCTAANVLTFTGCLNTGGTACTSFGANLTLRASMIPSGQNAVDLPVLVKAKDACGNQTVTPVSTIITLKRIGTLDNNANNSDNSIATSDGEANIPAEASTVPTLQGEMKCFPNPFTEDLNIQYNLTEAIDNVTLKIYDNQGGLAAKMEQESQATGFYQVRWNLSYLQSGMYHVCLELNGKCTKTQRVIMMQ